MVEDSYGTCEPGVSIDFYAGHALDAGLIECEHRMTPDGLVALKVSPPPGRPVDTIPIYEDGRCIR